MADPTDIREALAASLAAIDGVQASAWSLDNPTPPTLQVLGVDNIDYDTAFGGSSSEQTWIVQGFAGEVSQRGAQARLARWYATTGDESVKAAIELDNTLGGAVDQARVTSYTGDKVVSLPNQTRLLMGEWHVEVIT